MSLSPVAGPSVRGIASARLGDGFYRVTIAMSAETVDALLTSGACLYGFKAVAAWDKAAVPLVWLRTEQYSLRTSIAWEERYEAFTSPSTPKQASASYPIEPDQTLEVTSRAGTGVVVPGGTAGAVTIANQTTSPLVCGLAQPVNGAFAFVCELPLYGKNVDLVYPRKVVLFMFSTVPLEPETPARISYGPGILIDFGDTLTREVSFDVNAGWSWGGGAWAKEIPALTNIVPLLVVAPL